MSGFDISSVVLSVLGVVGSLKLVHTLLKNRLPEAQLRELNNIIVETDSLFRRALEEGLPFDNSFINRVDDTLLQLEEQAKKARIKIDTEQSFQDRVFNLLDGLNGAIVKAKDEAKDLRARLSVACAEHRRLLEEQGTPSRIPLGEPTAVQPERAPITGVPISATGTQPGGDLRSIYSRPVTSARSMRPDAFVTGDRERIVGGSDAANNAGGSGGMHITVGNEHLQMHVMNQGGTPSTAHGMPQGHGVSGTSASHAGLGSSSANYLTLGTRSSTNQNQHSATGRSAHEATIEDVNANLEGLIKDVSHLTTALDKRRNARPQGPAPN